jgi:ABC-type branched-subunit amino acid transport system substrate-binding protein
VYYSFSATTTETYTALEQAACSTWTEDDRVFAVLGHPAVHVSDNLRACLERRGVVVVASGLSHAADALTYQRFPHFATAGGPSLDRVALALARGLVAERYFEGTSGVAVVTHDIPAFRRATDSVLEPELRAHGITLEQKLYLSAPDRSADFATESTQASNAVLRLNAAGVTHVILLERSGSLGLAFMRAADSQRYRPRYGLTSATGGQLTAGMVSPAALAGAVSIGWIPLIDVGEGPTFAPPPAYGACLDVVRRGGAAAADLVARWSAAATCDIFQVFRAAAAGAGSSLTADAFMRSLESLGDSVAAASVYSLRYAAGRRDGTGAVRHTRFDTGCACFRYTGGPVEFP